MESCGGDAHHSTRDLSPRGQLQPDGAVAPDDCVAKAGRHEVKPAASGVSSDFADGEQEGAVWAHQVPHVHWAGVGQPPPATEPRGRQHCRPLFQRERGHDGLWNRVLILPSAALRHSAPLAPPLPSWLHKVVVVVVFAAIVIVVSVLGVAAVVVVIHLGAFTSAATAVALGAGDSDRTIPSRGSPPFARAHGRPGRSGAHCHGAGWRFLRRCRRRRFVRRISERGCEPVGARVRCAGGAQHALPVRVPLVPAAQRALAGAPVRAALVLVEEHVGLGRCHPLGRH